MKHIIVTVGLLLAACNPQKGSVSFQATFQSSADSVAFVGRSGNQLTLQGQPTAFVGFNRYDLGGGPPAGSCQHNSDPAAYAAYAASFIQQAAAQGATLLRLWAFQNFAGPSGTDFSALDTAVTSAKQNNVRLILTLENNWGDCTQPAGVTKDDAWFGGGYRSNYGYPLTFPQYVDAIVNHFKNEPTVAMWQIINEGKWYQQPDLLTNFINDIAAQIKSIDSQHLVSGGGALQCWEGDQGATDFQNFSGGPNVDVLDTHDYGSEAAAWPTCMAQSLTAAQNLNKPLIIGEAGISDTSFSTAQRAQYFAAKMQAAAQNGVQAYLIWSMSTPPDSPGEFDVVPGDPTMAVVQQAAQQWFVAATPASNTAPTPTPTDSGCTASLQPAASWQVDANDWGAPLNIIIQNTGSQVIAVPWTVEVWVQNMSTITTPWNWDITGQQGSYAKGLVTQDWGTLQPQSGSNADIGGIITLSQPQVIVQQVAVNGQLCSVK